MVIILLQWRLNHITIVINHKILIPYPTIQKGCYQKDVCQRFTDFLTSLDVNLGA